MSAAAARALLAAVALGCGAPAAELRLSASCSDGAVLQREASARLWGWAEPGAEVEARASWDGAVRRARAGADGRFEIRIATGAAGGPHRIEVSAGGETRTVSDVLLGDVWLASGQSNMAWPLERTEGGQAFAAEARDRELRFFQVAQKDADEEVPDVSGAWIACAPEIAPGLSAVAYHFARRLRRELGVPIGVVHASWGGTIAEAWMSPEALRAFPEVRLALGTRGPNRPSALYRGMIAPLTATAIRGVIWYQGESNVGRAETYRRLFPALVSDWRARFAQGDFPFLYVQVAPFGYPNDRGELAALREAQALAHALPNVGMAVTMDVGDPGDIHPGNKDAVGERLARLALARAYGHDVRDSGPTFRALSVEGALARVSFDHAEGLTSGGAPPRCFTVAGADRIFHSAEAWIEGETVVLESTAVGAPVAVRFAWAATDVPNLWNAAGLPAPSFRTDDWDPLTR